jgi:hypothetical protein
MIQFTKSYQTSTGEVFATIEGAQRRELAVLLKLAEDSPEESSILNYIMQNTTAIVNILTTSENSRPKARKANGAVRKPRKTTPPADANATSMPTT